MTSANPTSTPTTRPHSGDTRMSAAAATPVKTTNTAGHLRRLYFVRFVFAAAWAGAFAATGSSLDAGSITLLILYPAFDVAIAPFECAATALTDSRT